MKKLTQPQNHLTISQIKTLISQSLHSEALKSSLHISPFSPSLTDQIYALFLKSGRCLTPRLATALISRFFSANDHSRALPLLSDTKSPDLITYNAVISGFARTGPVFGLFDGFRQMGLWPDVFSLSSLVKGCERLRENEVAHGICWRLGFQSSAYVVSGLIDNYAKNLDLESAEGCFEECLDVDNVVCTSMISGFVWNGEFQKGKECFEKIRGLGLELNEFSLSSVIGAVFDVKEGEKIHALGLKMGFLYDCSMHLSNAVISMYNRCGSQVDAVKVFEEISMPDVVSWTERIGASDDGEEALELFKKMHSMDLDVNEYTLISILSVIGGVKLLTAGNQIHALCHKAGYFQAVSVGNILVSMYGNHGQVLDARCVFDCMSSRDSVSWNSLIAAYSDNGFFREAEEVFSQMRAFSLQPTVHTLASILDTVTNSDCAMKAMQIHSLVIKCGLLLDDSMVSCLVTAYGRCNNVEESKRVFAETNRVNLVIMNTMISTLVHAGCHADALEFFQNAWSSDMEVDGNTFSVVLKACAAITAMEQGRAIHSLALKSGFNHDRFVESAVVDIYSKCGSIGEAEKAFRSTDNLASWNAMMMGYAQHGRFQVVFELFNGMSELGIRPDEISYLSVLTACCHAGLVKEARHFLNSMFELHGIVPHLKHYACMVDLLGRVGLLEDANETIDHMPIEPDVHIWQILLSACSIHGHVELGRVAASKLLELQPGNESAYVLLSNLYASAGMWNAVGKLRKEMKEKVLHKEPGSSWIQVGGLFHYFLVSDTSHLESREIFMELTSLYEQMSASPELEEDDVFLCIYAM